MIKLLVSATFVLALGTAASAAPSASTRQAATSSSAQKYWLSDGLNRLVFWRAPVASPKAEATSAR